MTVKKVLICDDSSPERLHISRIVAGAGCTVILAHGGKEALELAKKEKPDLIFLDVIMPEWDGYETCRQLRTDPETRDIPVVFVTGNNKKSDLFYAKMQGGKDLIGKPVKEEDLLQQVNP